MNDLPETIADEARLEALLAQPAPAVVELMGRLDGDLLLLGAGGKMGASLARQAVLASRAAGRERRIIAASRFSDAPTMDVLRADGIEPVRCDLLDADQVARLPDAANVIYLAGRKFGTSGDAAATWASNVIAPLRACERFASSRIVAFSTGCVYPLVEASSGGCCEQTAPAPVGEYAQSCLGRERIFQHAALNRNTPICLLRLNYAVEMRYGVLHDIARQVVARQAVDASVPNANAIWQGDANAQALLALDCCSVPATVLNITGPECFAIESVARAMGQQLGLPVEVRRGTQAIGYLSDASRASDRFGYPRVPLHRLVAWTADWVAAGRGSLGKPTHFEVNTGSY